MVRIVGCVGPWVMGCSVKVGASHQEIGFGILGKEAVGPCLCRGLLQYMFHYQITEKVLPVFNNVI